MKTTDDQPPPTPERADLPAVWDLVIEDMSSALPGMQDGDEPPPVENVYPAVLAVTAALSQHLGTDLLADMRERDAIGRQRYGTPLQPHNGRRALVDAYQELLDAAVYLRQHLCEQEPTA